MLQKKTKTTTKNKTTQPPNPIKAKVIGNKLSKIIFCIFYDKSVDGF